MAVRLERNSEKSRQDILAAAEQEFADKGFFGARIDEIALVASINKRMLYEYFGNKEELYKSVLLMVYKRMEIAECALIEKNVSGVELISNLISMYFDFLHANPTFVSILMWENLCKAKYLTELPVGEVARPTIKFFMEEIRKGKETGIFKATIDEEQVAISLITVCFANFSNRYTLSKLFNCDLDSSELVEIRKQHTISMMLTYIQK